MPNASSLQPPRRLGPVALLAATVLAVAAVAGLALGLVDLAGRTEGSTVRIALAAPSGTGGEAMARARDVLLRRLGGLGDTGATAEVGGAAIVLSVPEPTTPGDRAPSVGAALARDLTAPGHLEEREVLDDTPADASTARLTACPGAAAPAALPCPGSNGVECPSPDAAGCADADLAGREVMLLSDDGQDVFRLGPVLITGADVAAARAVLPPPAPVADVRVPQWQIRVTLSRSSIGRFAALTQRLVGRRLAIVVDRGVVTAPEIAVPITDGTSAITGRFTGPQARELATALASGQLPVALSVASIETRPNHRTIGAPWIPLGIGLAAVVGLAALGLAGLRTRDGAAAEGPDPA